MFIGITMLSKITIHLTIIVIAFVSILTFFSLGYVGDSKGEMESMFDYETGDEIITVAISSTGKYTVVGSNDHRVYFFDKGNSTPRWEYQTGGLVSSVAISSDGNYIVAGSYDHKIYLFGKESSTPIWNSSIGSKVFSIAISSDGEYIVAGSENYKVTLFNKDNPENLWNYQTGDGVYSVAISSDGEYIVAGSGDAYVYFFNKDSSIPLWSYQTYSLVNSVTITPDGEFIAAGSHDNRVYLFNKNDSNPLWSSSTGGWVYSVSISSDGNYIVAGSRSKSIYLFGKDDPEPLWNYVTDDYVHSVSISENGSFLVGGSRDNNLYLFEKESSIPVWKYSAGDNVRCVSMSSTGKFIVAGSFDKKMYLLYDNEQPSASIIGFSSNPGLFSESIIVYGEGTDDGTIVRYSWHSNIDGLLFNGTTSQFSLSNLSMGVHEISFRVQDNQGLWSDIVNANLVIHKRPIALIESISPNPGLFSSLIHFTGNSIDDGTVETYSWRSDKNELYNGSNFVFTKFDLPLGNHTIFLKVQDNYGVWSEEVESTLIIHEKPIALIELMSPNPCLVNETIFFRANGTDGWQIELYAWRTNSEELYNGTDPEFSYSTFTSGTYTVFLKVQNIYGAWSEEIPQMLLVHEKPLANSNSINPNPAIEGELLTFIGNGTDDGMISNYRWKSSIDGLLYNGNNNSFTSDSLSVGTHDIDFCVQDDHSAWSENVTISVIVNPRNYDPTVKINELGIDKTNPRDGDEVTVSFSVEKLSQDKSDDVIVHIKYGSKIVFTATYYQNSQGQILSDTINFKVSEGTTPIEIHAWCGDYNITDEMTLTVKKAEEKDESILFRKFGPLPLVGYIGLAMLIIILGVGIVMKKRGKIDGGMTQDSTHTAPPLSPSPQSLNQSPRTHALDQSSHQPQNPQYLPVQMEQPQQHSNPTLPQQQVTVYSSKHSEQNQPPSPIASSIPGGNWYCHQCNTTVDGQYAFCLSCGYRKGS